MKIENQVCTPAQAEKLKELGVSQNQSYFYYYSDQLIDDTSPKPFYKVIDLHREEGKELPDTAMSAFTVAELGVMLPPEVYTMPDVMPHAICFVLACEAPLCFHLDTTNTANLWVKHKTEAEARAAMLIHLLENKLITIDEVNKRLSEQ